MFAMRFNRYRKDFQRALLEDEKNVKACLALGVDEAKEMRAAAWAKQLERCFVVLAKSRKSAESDPKSSTWKIAVAAFMKKTRLCRIGWLAEELVMGTESSVARYVSEFFRGRRTAAQEAFYVLTTEVLD